MPAMANNNWFNINFIVLIISSFLVCEIVELVSVVFSKPPIVTSTFSQFMTEKMVWIS